MRTHDLGIGFLVFLLETWYTDRVLKSTYFLSIAKGDTMYCKKCGAYLSNDALYCNNCGTSTSQGSGTFCPNCGAACDTNANCCPRCGTVLNQTGPGTNQAPGYNPPPPGGYAPYRQPRSRLVAGLLGIFLGSLGIHNFYLGYTTKAVVQLLITLIGGMLTCGLASIGVGIWSFVEAILIFTGNISCDGDGMPLRD